MVAYTTHSEAETIALGKKIGERLTPNSIVCFFGDLAAGKTTFIKGIAAAFEADRNTAVTSPTFTYLNIYTGIRTLYHFDLYRLRDADEFLSMGFEEYLFAGGICCIEWSERIAELLPPHCIKIEMQHVEGVTTLQTIRLITIL